jgi:transposase
MVMLAELVEVVIGVDPDRDRVTAVAVNATTTGEIAAAVFDATGQGYEQLREWADGVCGSDARAWSVEGAGSYGAGATEALTTAGEWVIEFDHPTGRAAADGAKSDTLDALRAAREVLGRTLVSRPRARGHREAMRVIVVTRDGAVTARTAAINELKALVVTAPERLRAQLRGCPTNELVARCSRLRVHPTQPVDEQATRTAMTHLAKRIRTLTAEADNLERDLGPLVDNAAPQLLDEMGVSYLTAAQILISWSHPGRCRHEAAFARLAGVAPIDATSGKTQNRHRLNRGGDRQLNRALHTIALCRARNCPTTKTYIARRKAEGKTDREIRRSLKRYIARHLYRILEHPLDGT